MSAVLKKVLDRVIFDSDVSERKILIVPVASIKHTPYNPKSRTKDGAKLRALVESCRKNGVIYPILISADRDVIDGNRRLAAARILGMEKIECIVCNIDRDEAFATVNTTAEKIGGKGWLEAGRGGCSLPKKEASEYRELYSLVGSYGVDLLISQNIGLNILQICKQVCSFGTMKRLEEVIMATALKKLTNKLNFEIRSGKPREEVMQAMDLLLESA
jgi:hypothetical protein